MGRSCLACLTFLPTLLIIILPNTSSATVSNTGVREVGQAVRQLTQRFATLEVSLQSRLARLEDAAVKGESVMEALAERLNKVDSLVEKVEELEERLTTETSTIHSTSTDTSTHLQGVSARLEALESIVRGVGLGRGRHDTRSPTPQITEPDERLTALVRDSVREAVDRTLDHTLTTFHNTLYKRLSQSVEELQKAVIESRSGLEELGTRTLETATGTRRDLQDGGKTTQDAVLDIKNKIHSVHQDLSLKIASPPSLHTLGPVLQQVNHSVVESITRATQNLNVTSLLDQAVRRRGGGGGGGGGGGLGTRNHRTQLQDPHTQHCPDPTTVAALLEVKQLLHTLLKKSEDLRRSLTKQTNHGLDLLTLLQQRISVIMRRMNTEPDHSQMLVSEMQDLGSLVESSYMAVLVAQNAFIDSCKRIQDEEPMLEHKMTEILDKLVTNIDLGYQHNHQQLAELKEVVQRMAERTAASISANNDDTSHEEVIEDEGYAQENTPPAMPQVRSVIEGAVERTNSTVEGLEEVEERVDQLSTTLLSTDWSDLRQKEPADNLVTAAKDLKRFAQEQILRALDLHEALIEALDHLDTTTTTTPTTTTTAGNTSHLPHLPHIHLTTDFSTTLTLPPSCTNALINHMQHLANHNSSSSSSSSYPSSSSSSSSYPSSSSSSPHEEEEEEEEEVPAWYTDPDFLSGNYGTPDLEFPVFREDEWVYMDELDDVEEGVEEVDDSEGLSTSSSTQEPRNPPSSTQDNSSTHTDSNSSTYTYAHSTHSHTPSTHSRTQYLHPHTQSTHAHTQITTHTHPHTPTTHSQTHANSPTPSQTHANPPTSTHGLSTSTTAPPSTFGVDRFFGFMDRGSSSTRRRS